MSVLEAQLAELIRQRNERDEARILIENQLLEAKQKAFLEREYSDPVWFRKATMALKFAKRDCQRLQEAISAVRQQIRRANTGQPGEPSKTAAIIKAMRVMLSPEAVEQILELSDQFQRQAGE